MKLTPFVLTLLCLPFLVLKADATIIVSTSSSLCGGSLCPPPPAPTSSYGGLIVNGDFGFGNFTGFSGTATQNTDKTQGGVTGNSNYSYHYAYLASASGDQTLYQTFSTTPGGVYTISFSLDNFNQFLGDTSYTGSTAYDFSAKFGDQVLLSFASPANPSAGYGTFTYQAVADSNSTTLLFSASNAPGSFNLTNISVYDAPIVTPEPSGLFLLGTGAASLLALAQRRVRRVHDDAGKRSQTKQ